MDIYEGLNETEIRAVFELANKAGREYKEVAEAVGVSVRHLYRLRQKPQIKKAVRETVISELEDDIPDIVSTLKKNMKKGDFRSTELLAKMTGLLVERREINQTTTVQDNRFKDMSSEDIEEELQAIENELKLIEGGVK